MACGKGERRVEEGTVIYLVVIKDRHTDDKYVAFFNEGKAMTRAHQEIEQLEKNYNVTPEELHYLAVGDRYDGTTLIPGGFLFHASLEDCGSVAVRRVYILS